MPDSTLPPDSIGATRADGSVPEHAPGDDEPRFISGDRVGRYVILSSLGKGGMSVVYLAYDPELDRKVALKLMRVTMLGEKGKLRLQREAQALAKLSHPNVVPVYDAGTVGDQAFVAMEYVEGKTLRHWLRDPHDWRAALDVMLEAGRGLAAAHAAGLVHRDFKPDNVVIGEDGRVRVLDFGLARLASVLDGSALPSTPTLDDPPSEAGVALVPSSKPGLTEVTRADQLIGTPAYMAPEQMRMESIDERADQYAFCVTLYEALHGKRPFEVTSEEIASALSTASIVTARPKVTRALRPPPRGSPVPSWMQRVVARGMSDDAGARWPKMDDLLRALGDDPRRKWQRWGMALAGLAVAGAMLGVVARAQSRTRAMCRGGESRVETIWGPSARAEVAGAFARTHVPYADDATRTVTQGLDAYAAKWAAMSDDACAATRIRGEQSEDVLDLRAACLSDRIKELTALVDVLRHADLETVEQASHATESLGPLSDCADIAALRSPTPRPRDKETAARIDDVEKRLALVEATQAVGKSAEAAKLGEEALATATAIGFAPLVARIDYWRARAYADQNESEHSIPAFRDAFALALGAREERVLRWSSARLAQEYVYAEKPSPGDFEYWSRVSEQALVRSGPDAELESFLAHMRCVAMWSTGGLQTRLDCLAKHAARTERTRPLNEWELVTIGLAASDAGEYEHGVAYIRRGYEYSFAKNGAAHPKTLEMRGYLCKGLLDYGDLDAALSECTLAEKDAARVAPDNQFIVGKIRMYLGATLRELHRYAEARAFLELARPYVNPPEEALYEIALNEEASGRSEEALAYFTRSLAGAQKELPAVHSNVIRGQVALAEAKLAAGDAKGARALLDDASEVAGHAEISPQTRADLAFDEARALWRSAPPDHARALELAARARDEYAAHMPPTARYTDARRRIEAWIASPDGAK